MVSIYSISCPKTGEVRYVGKTSHSLENRLQQHLIYARIPERKRRYVSDWLLSLDKKGLIPTISQLEQIEDCCWEDREKYWIKYFREQGNKLCNLTDGGESFDGYQYTEELREIRRQARLGWVPSEETRSKISRKLSRAVICVEEDKEFESMKQAAEYYKVPRSTFNRRFHKSEKINGFTFVYKLVE